MTKILILLMTMIVNIYCQVNSSNDNENGYIVGGQNAKIIDFPFMVVLRIIYDNYATGKCGGVYIHELWVLTAAHCLVINEDYPPDVGRHDRVWTIMGLEKEDQKKYQASLSVKLIAHPQFTSKRNDIGLIEIQDPFNITSSVNIGKLLTSAVPEGAKVTAIGWGATKPTDTQASITPPRRLQKVDLKVWEASKCSEVIDSQSIICVGQKGKTPCYGDSGGPLVYKKVIVGITSWGKGCNSSVAVYEAIFYHLLWIKDTTGVPLTETSSVCNIRATYIIYFIIVVLMKI